MLLKQSGRSAEQAIGQLLSPFNLTAASKIPRRCGKADSHQQAKQQQSMSFLAVA